MVPLDQRRSGYNAFVLARDEFNRALPALIDGEGPILFGKGPSIQWSLSKA
jgi:hypothetical protein